jgi:hypothetical protein
MRESVMRAWYITVASWIPWLIAVETHILNGL